jgi:hypothetical protein
MAVKRTVTPGVDRLIRRTETATAQARAYNETLPADHQDTLYLGTINALAKTVWELASNIESNPETFRIYFDCWLRQRQQADKEKKTAIMLRHVELLEAKRKLLEEAAKDRGLTDAQFFGKIREVFFPANNGNGTEPQKTRLLGNGLAS